MKDQRLESTRKKQFTKIVENLGYRSGSWLDNAGQCERKSLEKFPIFIFF